jgi:hypothetical protein
LERQLAAKPLGKEVCQKGAQPHPSARRLGCEKRLKHSIQNFRCHSTTLVANQELDVVPLPANLQMNGAVLRARVEGILNEGG